MDERHQQAHDVRIVNSFGVGTARYCSCWPSPFWARSGTNRDFQDLQGHDDVKSLHDSKRVVGSATYVDVPLGCNMVRWDIDRQRRVRFFRPHGDIVTCMLKTDEFIFTASEAGEVALWDHAWSLLDRSYHSTRRVKVTHAAVSPCGRRVVTTSEHAGGVITLFKVFRHHQDGEDAAAPAASRQLRLVKESEFGEGANYTFVEWADDDGDVEAASILVAVRQPPRASRHTLAAPSVSAQEHDQPATALHQIQVGGRSGEWRVIKQRALEMPIASVGVSPSGRPRPSIVSVSAVAKEETPPTRTGREPIRMAVALNGRQVEVVDMRTLATLWTIDASGGSGLIKCLAFKPGGRLLCPGDNARLSVWDHDRLVGEFTLGGLSSGSIYYVNCDDGAREAWVVNEAGIHSCPLLRPSPDIQALAQRDDTEEAQAPPERHMSFHGMTCCGLDFNLEGTQVAVGDFAGNVIVWDVGSHLPIATTRVPSLLPVRSICWRRPTDPSHAAHIAPHVLIGCVSGEIYSWNPFRPDVAPLLVATLEDTVTCMRWEHGDEPRLLAAGTTNGNLHVMKLLPLVHDSGTASPAAATSIYCRALFEDVLVFKAHQPVAGPQNLQFGSIGLFAEIWSLAWSPDNGAIATCSEDQTTCVWDLTNGEKRRTLTGHTTAVTGVDWQLMRLPSSAAATTPSTDAGWQEVLATCADDRKVMVWNARTWELLHVFDTSDDIHDWHTLTYCALQPRGDKLCCVTQNGAVAVWNLGGEEQQRKRRWVGKLHTGSVEGLAWSPASDMLATCSSDCTVHLLRHSLSPSS